MIACSLLPWSNDITVDETVVSSEILGLAKGESSLTEILVFEVKTADRAAK